jgi:hypothetical protein
VVWFAAAARIGSLHRAGRQPLLLAARRVVLPAATLACLCLAGCGVKEEVATQPAPTQFLVFAPQTARIDLLPLRLAAQEGRLRPAGIEPVIQTTPTEAQALNRLTAGEGQAAVLTQSEVLLARDRGLAVVAVASLDQASSDEPVLAVRVREAERDGEALRALLLPLGGAAARLRANPALGVALLGQTHLSSAARRRLEGEVVTVATPQPNQPYGYQDPATWSALAQSLYSRHLLIHDPTTLAPPYTNEYLPGQGL